MVIESLIALFDVIQTFLSVEINALFGYANDANKRIYIGYLLSSLLLAVPVYVSFKRGSAQSSTPSSTLPSTQPPTQPASLSGFFRFLFPKSIWFSKSAKQDYVLWVLNRIVKALLFAPLILTMVPIAIGLSDILDETFGKHAPLSTNPTVVIATFTLLLFLFDDFTRFILHYVLHKVPFLWEFHKVHHSAKVLTPFTIYRSHPVETYLYACRMAIAQGAAVGVGYYLFGPRLSMFDIAGANVFVFVFNLFGSNLRHSHVWLSWGNKVEKWFISPAQHQIHHSDNPVHFDKNLGSALSIWDRVFGTFVLASAVKYKDGERLTFGISQTDPGHSSVLAAYVSPFINIGLKVKRVFVK